MPEDVTIIVGATALRAESVTVERAIDAAASSARATVPLEVGRWARPGMQFFVRVGRTVIFDGFLEAVAGRSDSQGGNVELAGRDRAALLIDGSAREVPLSWRETTLLQIAQDLARPYGVPVIDRAQAVALRLDTFAAEPGEAAISILDRAARRFGVLIHSDEFGSVVLDKVSIRRSAGRIESGSRGTVASYTWRNDHGQRFRRYSVLGAPRGAFDALYDGPALEAPRAEAFDPSVRAERERTIISPDAVDGDECLRLAHWHLTVDRARSASVEVVLPGWRERDREDAELWRLNRLARVRLHEVGYDEQLLIAGVRFEQRDGDTTTLRLVRPDSFQPELERERAPEDNQFAGLLE